MAQKYVGITLPIRSGNTGMFEQSTSTFQQVRSNFKNLILTKRGERIMQPEFGTDLHRILFEQVTPETIENTRLSIVQAVDRWMPFLELTEFDIQTPVNEDVYRMDIRLSYRFRNNPNVTDTIIVSV